MNIVLIAIIALNLIISFKGFNDIAFFRKYEFHIGSIRAGDQVRMFSSAFLHGDIMHLFFNMFTLFMFAPVVIKYMGSFSFAMVYIGSLVFGNLLTLYMHKNDYSYRAIGASGAVTGVLYSAILFRPEMSVFFEGFPAYVFGILYLFSSIYGIKAKKDNVGHTAHFGGAIGGYVITLVKEPHMFTDNTLTVALLAIPIIILFIMERMGKL